MQINFAVINDSKEFQKILTMTKKRKMQIQDNKIVTRIKYNKKLIIQSILLGKSIYLKDNANNYYNKFCKLKDYEKIPKANLVEVGCKLIIDIVNKYVHKKEDFDIIITKLKHKYYLNLITPNYYYIFRFKNNNFKLIKKFKYWYSFAIDEEYNLYSIDRLMQIYKIPKSFSRYNEFVNIVNNIYFESIKFIYFVNGKSDINYSGVNYLITYIKNEPIIKEITITLGLFVYMHLIIGERIYFEHKYDLDSNILFAI